MNSHRVLLDIYTDMGVDFACTDVPVNHLLNVKLNQIPLTTAVSETLISVQEAEISTAQHPAWQAKNRDELLSAMQDFDACSLKLTATTTVFCDGNPNSDVMIIGEAPGAEEDMQGKPFVGQSGQLVDLMMAAIGYDRTRSYISNIIPWRPPGNRPPTSQEIALCQPFIERHIELISPKLLILLGGVSAKALLKTNEGIMKLRGQFLSYITPNGKNIPVMATFHPAYLLRSPGNKALVWQDLMQVERFLAPKK